MSTMPDTLAMTPSEITAAALAYNSDYPEAAAEILAGSPVVRVYIHEQVRDYRRVSIVRTAGVTAPDGGFIAAGDPEVLGTNAPRYPVAKLAAWYGGKLAGEGVTVQVVQGG